MTDNETTSTATRREALKAYAESDMTIGRGAELAGMSQEQFVDLLEQNNMRPDYGPVSVDELYSGANLTTK
jgi:predicted HTH domain antitoxin